jgi:hypothetical protein
MKPPDERREAAVAAYDAARSGEAEVEPALDRIKAAARAAFDFANESDEFSDRFEQWWAYWSGEERAALAEHPEPRQAEGDLQEAAREALVVLAALKLGDVRERHVPELWDLLLRAHDLLLAALSHHPEPGPMVGAGLSGPPLGPQPEPRQDQPVDRAGNGGCTCRKPPKGMIGWDRGMVDRDCPHHGHEALPEPTNDPQLDAVVGALQDGRERATLDDGAVALWRPNPQHPWREWESDKSDEVQGEMLDFVPLAVAQRVLAEHPHQDVEPERDEKFVRGWSEGWQCACIKADGSLPPESQVREALVFAGFSDDVINAALASSPDQPSEAPK